jgi:hypothetical protein
MTARSGKYGWTCQEWIKAVNDIQNKVISLGAPPLLIGLDSLHGTNYILGSTIFPHVRSNDQPSRFGADLFHVDIEHRLSCNI